MVKYSHSIVAFLVMIMVGGSLHTTAQTDEITGTWQSIGYGLWFTVEEEAVNVYQVTEVSCLPMVNVPQISYQGQSVLLHEVTLAGVGQYFGTFEFELTLADGLLNFDAGKLHPIQAQRAESLPALCDNPTADTPQNTFETFWHVFNENYAFFELRGVDWQHTYDTYQPLITDDMTEEELFAVLKEMIAPLGDGHVSINSTFESFSPVTIPAWYGSPDESAIGDYAILPANYLLEEPQFTTNNIMAYGKLSDTVGFITILGFDGFSESEDDLAVLSADMATIWAAFQGVETVVVDIRFNLGGDDANGLFVAGQFTAEPYLVFSKSVWFEGEFYPIMDFYVEPTTDQPFTGEVYLLTSGMSLSAAETFALAMTTLPNVTVVGEATNGIFSDQWFGILPNGWLASLSNEQYLSSEGVSYEGLGVSPDIEILLSAEDFAAGHDPMVEAVLELIP